MESEYVKEPLTNHERVYGDIKSAIIEGLIPGGSRVIETALAKRFNVSRTPVREALLRLSAEHLVSYASNGGAYIPAVSQQDIADVYKVRGALEGLAAKLTCSRQPSQKELRLLIHHVELAELSLDEGDLVEVERHNSAFHKNLVDLADNTFLSRQLYLVQPFTYFLRRQVIDIAATDDEAYNLYKSHLQVNMIGHRRIVEILEAGDEDEAHLYLMRHIEEASVAMIALLPKTG